MKPLGSQARRRSPDRFRRRNRLLASAAVVITGLASFLLIPSAPENPLPLARTPAEAPVASVVATAPAPQPRAPFEPLVEGQLKRLSHAEKLPPPMAWQNVTVATGDNLSLIFSRLKLSRSDLHTIASLKDAGPVLRRLKPGQLIRFQLHDNRLERMVVEVDDLNSLWVERAADGFAARSESVVPEIRVTNATAQINRSLFLDGQKAGLSDATIMRLTEIFGWDIDFALDIRQKDYFSVIYEEAYKDGELIKQGRILAAEFVNRGRSLRAVLFTDDEGNSDYYSEEGHAMRKAFLRTPVNFSRISSHFNLRRKHPVLNKIRAHRGVDYAAPLGTPIRATANGKIKFVGRKGGYGKTIQMQHGQAYSTLYAHLSRYRKGLKRGASVKQGQIIGYVGKSGLATGPHLHYEFRVNGTHRNPLTVDLPKAEPIGKRYLSAFRQHAAPYLSRLDTLYAAHSAPAGAEKIVAQVDPELLLPARPAQR